MTIILSDGHTKIVADTNKTFINKDYIISDTVILGANDSIDNYTEISVADAQRIQAILELPDNPEINAVLSEIIDIPVEEHEEESEENT